MAESDNADKTFASFLKDMSQLSASEESILQGSPSLNQYSPASIQSTFSFSQGPPARATSSSQMSITFQEFQRRDVHYSSQYYCLNTLHHLSSSFTAENIKNSTSLFKFQTQRRVPSVLRYAADLSGGAGKSMSLGSSRFKANSGYVSSSTSWTRAKSILKSIEA